MPETEAQQPVKPRFRAVTVAVYIALALGAGYLWVLTSRQRHLNEAVETLATAPEAAMESLRATGPPAFAYLATALHYHDDAQVRRLAGQALVQGLLRELDAQVAAHPDDAPDAPSPAALAKADAVLAGVESVGALGMDAAKVKRLMAYLDEHTTGAVQWQKRMRLRCEVDKISRALGDESPAVRAAAAAVLEIIGPATRYDTQRMAGRRTLEAALAAVRSGTPQKRAEARAALIKLERFGLRAMAGEIANAAVPFNARLYLAHVLLEIMKKQFSANAKSEAVELISPRASARLMPALFEGRGELREALMNVFTLSPKVTRGDLEKLAAQVGPPRNPQAAAALVARIAELEGK